MTVAELEAALDRLWLCRVCRTPLRRLSKTDRRTYCPEGHVQP